MEATLFDQVESHARTLGVDLRSEELALLAERHSMGVAELEAVARVFEHLGEKKREAIVTMLLKTSRLPMKSPKTFDGFDFGRVHGKNVKELENLRSLSALYAHKNIAFIGPEGVGKTHLAMALGRECCMNGMKTYFLKATELRDRLKSALATGREARAVTSLVKPSCLIIDEIGRCKFNYECTNLFFDIVDRRYQKEGPSTMVFTSNSSASEWGKYFTEESTILCALDRIFDDATVFLMEGRSKRGENLVTLPIKVDDGPMRPKKD